MVVLPATTPGAFDSTQHDVLCATDDGDHTTVSDHCPVIRWNGLEYGALAYTDNRSSFAIHAFDAPGNVVGVQELPGARYLYSITIDSTAKVITFTGQAAQTATLTFTELAAIK